MDVKGSKKTLVMREINEESVSSLLEKRDALADCDVAVFVYDGSNAASWNRTVDLLVEVAAHGEKYGFEVPCLLVAAKDDLEPDPICHQSSIQVCTDMGVEAPFTVSMKLGDIGNLFQRIVDAAQQPNLSVPETEAGKSNKNYQCLVQRSLTIAAGKLNPHTCSPAQGLMLSEGSVFFLMSIIIWHFIVLNDSWICEVLVCPVFLVVVLWCL